MVEGAEKVRTIIVIEVKDAQDELRDYLEFIKKQINKYSQGLMDYTVIKDESEIDAESRKYRELDKWLPQNKKAPSAKGAMKKISPKS